MYPDVLKYLTSAYDPIYVNSEVSRTSWSKISRSRVKQWSSGNIGQCRTVGSMKSSISLTLDHTASKEVQHDAPALKIRKKEYNGSAIVFVLPTFII